LYSVNSGSHDGMTLLLRAPRSLRVAGVLKAEVR
jgi:hypothetical protein